MYDLAFSFILDLILGDPYWFPHPVRIMGSFIVFLEGWLRKAYEKPVIQKAKGLLLVFTVITLTYFITHEILELSCYLGSFFYHLMNILLVYTALAMKSLAVEARKVYNALKNMDLEGARKYLSYIVGRDTMHLDQKEIARAAVETVAENISDGIIAPMFYYFIGGVPLMMLYKAVNTMDSMLGYKNEKYIYFGYFAAKTDDLFNLIPARLTGLILIPLASLFLGYNFKKSFNIALRDGLKHNSPNSGYPEAAVAGALGIQLGGINSYFGNKVYKPKIGDLEKEI